MDSFVALSPQSAKALSVLRVSASLPINIMIVGERGTGKETLVNTVFKNIAKYSAKDLEQTLPKEKEIFIRDFEKIVEVGLFMKKMQGVRVIAASSVAKDIYTDFFPVIVTIPPLAQRPEDLQELKRRYIQKVKEEFELEHMSEDFSLDLQKNAISLKKSIYEQALLECMDTKSLQRILEKFLEPQLEKGYKALLPLFEIPLLRAAKKRYKSALAMSKALQLNRATLTTKLKRYEKELTE